MSELVLENEKKLPKGWNSIQFSEIIKNIPLTGKKLKEKEYLKKGKLPVIDQGQNFIGGFTNNEKLQVFCNLPVIIFGDHTKISKFIVQEFVAGADGIKVLEPYSQLNSKYIYYFTKIVSLPVKGYARHFQYLAKSTIPISPLQEQKRIVEKIEELFSNIDIIKSTLETTKLQAKQYKQSMLKKIFSQITNFVPLSTIAEINPKLNKEKHDDEIDVSFIPMKNVEEKTGKIDYSISKKFQEVKKGYTFFKNKDVLFAKITPCMENGKIAIADNLINGIGFGSTEFHVLRFNSNGIPKFYFWYLIQDSFRNNAQRKMKGTAGQLRVSSSYLAEILVPFPSQSEQEQIILKIEQGFSFAENIEKTVNITLEQIETLKKSILKKAFEGRLVPQNPTDEPAEIILQRIKEEKRKYEEKIKQEKKKKSRRVKNVK